jgi:isocitrate/isopropylmalate dehydrogenase
VRLVDHVLCISHSQESEWKDLLEEILEHVPDHISPSVLMLPLRTSLNQWVNVRPTRVLRGTSSPLLFCKEDPKKLDEVIIRENSDGELCGTGRDYAFQDTERHRKRLSNPNLWTQS